MRNNRTPIQKPFEEYCLTIAAAVATKALKLQLGLIDQVSLGENIYDISLYAEGDGRICNRVYTMLQEKGVLATFNYSQRERYSYSLSSKKERKSYYGTVSEEWFKVNAPLLAKAPVFNTSGIVKVKEYSYSDEKNKLIKEQDNYRNLFGYGSFKDAEDIYIYLNFDEYDYQKRDERISSNRSGTNTHTHHTIYPKALLSKLSEGVFQGHAFEYVNKHLDWVMVNVLGIKDDKIINKLETSKLRTATFTIKDMEKWTPEHIEKQLQYISQYQNALKIGERSLLNLKLVVEKFGGWDKLKEHSVKAFTTYLEENFPLHLGEDEKDKDLKKLCEWVQLGKNRGFNERLQSIK